MLLLNRDATSTEIRGLLAEHLSHLEPSDAPLLEQAVDAATQLRLVSEHLDRMGGSLISAKGAPRPVATLYLSLHRLLLSLWDRLGVGPRARADLEAALGVSQTKPMRRAIETQRLLQADYGTSKELES
jgi:phage terminase small subunit